MSSGIIPNIQTVIEVLTGKPLLKAVELLNLMLLICLWLHNTRVDVFFSGDGTPVRVSDHFCFLSGCGRLLRHGRSVFLPPGRGGQTQHPLSPLMKDIVQLRRESRQAEARRAELIWRHSRHRHRPTPEEGRGVRVAAAMRRFGSERWLLCDL